MKATNRILATVITLTAVTSLEAHRISVKMRTEYDRSKLTPKQVRQAFTLKSPSLKAQRASLRLGKLGYSQAKRGAADRKKSPKANDAVWSLFTSGDIIKSSDPTAYIGLSYAGRGFTRHHFCGNFNAFLFKAKYDDGLQIEVQVHPNFGSTGNARKVAVEYAEVIGRLPTSLRKGVKTVMIQKGVLLFGGGNNNISIHTGQAARYVKWGVLEEILVHEAAHASLDPLYAGFTGDLPRWQAAQKADRQFISTYAKGNGGKEDIAESYLPYFAIRYRPSRISKALALKIIDTIPNRIKYFDSLNLQMHPVN